MGRVGDEALLALVGFLQASEHLVKGSCQRCQFIAHQKRRVWHALTKISRVTDIVCCSGHASNGREHAPANKPPATQSKHQDESASSQQQRAEITQIAFDIYFRTCCLNDMSIPQCGI